MATSTALTCANPRCASNGRCSGTGEYFRLEALNPRDAAGGTSRPSSTVHQPRLRIEEYWLCAHCADIYTLKYDHDARTVVGVKRPTIAESEFGLDSNPEPADNFLPIL
jgi:hypothetical protein